MAFSLPPRVQYLTAGFLNNHDSSRTPFLADRRIFLESAAGTSVYGVKHPGTVDTTQYSRFKQTITGNKAFSLPTASDAPSQTTGGATTAANQLRIVVLKNGVAVPRTRDDQVAAASSYSIGSGGGTAIADATLAVKGTTAADLLAGSALLSLASSGANTKTILVGDIIAITGDATVYRATATTISLNGTTEIEVAITPPLQQAVVATTAVTITTSDDRTVLFATAPTVNDIIEVLVFSASDVITMTGGALTAGRIYEETCYDYMYSAGSCNVTSAAG